MLKLFFAAPTTLPWSLANIIRGYRNRTTWVFQGRRGCDRARAAAAAVGMAETCNYPVHLFDDVCYDRLRACVRSSIPAQQLDRPPYSTFATLCHPVQLVYMIPSNSIFWKDLFVLFFAAMHACITNPARVAATAWNFYNKTKKKSSLPQYNTAVTKCDFFYNSCSRILLSTVATFMNYHKNALRNLSLDCHL